MWEREIADGHCHTLLRLQALQLGGLGFELQLCYFLSWVALSK